MPGEALWGQPITSVNCLALHSVPLMEVGVGEGHLAQHKANTALDKTATHVSTLHMDSGL